MIIPSQAFEDMAGNLGNALDIEINIPSSTLSFIESLDGATSVGFAAVSTVSIASIGELK